MFGVLCYSWQKKNKNRNFKTPNSTRNTFDACVYIPKVYSVGATSLRVDSKLQNKVIFQSKKNVKNEYTNNVRINRFKTLC